MTLALDKEGFLLNIDDWSPGVAKILAQNEGIELQDQHWDYFVFGHRHLPMEIQLNEASKYINLGDWIIHYTYAVFDGKELILEKFES